MATLMERVQQFCLADTIVNKQVADRIYYYSQQLNGKIVTELSRQNTPEIFDDNNQLLILPCAFITIETENALDFSQQAQADFLSVYLYNCSESVVNRFRRSITTINGEGVHEIRFVNSMPARYDENLRAMFSLVRFIVIRQNREAFEEI